MVSTQATSLCGEACSQPLTAPWSTYVKRKTRGIQSQVAPSLGRSCQCEVRIKTVTGEPRVVVTCGVDTTVEEMFNVKCTELAQTCIENLNNMFGFVLFLISCILIMCINTSEQMIIFSSNRQICNDCVTDMYHR